jgi:CheY-like chemotaxis protein
MPTTVLVVDDHASFRTSARLVLEDGGFIVVGEAVDGASAVAQAQRLRPDVVLLDVNLPDTDGFAVTGRLLEDAAPPTVVLTSSRARDDFGPLIPESGARGFVAKAELSGAAVAALVP